MATKSKGQVSHGLHTLIKGLLKHVDGTEPLLLGGKKYKREELIAFCQAQLEAIAQVEAAEARVTVLRAKRDALAQGHKPVIRALEHHLRATLGADNLTLAEFGFRPAKKRKKPSGQEMLKAAEKGRATREARGTVGKKERLKIKGKA